MSNSNDNEVIILRSVYGKVGQKYLIQPSKDPKTGRLPACVKRVNSQGDMILTDEERNSGKYFIAENETFTIEDGTTFNLNDEYQAKEWEAIKHCPLIAEDRYAKDAKGNYLIDGTPNKNSKVQRYGVAELYVYKPDAEVNKRVSTRKLRNKAENFILTDDRGFEGLLTKAKLLGKKMVNASAADVEDFLLRIAEKDPQRIIDVYTGSDTNLRLLLIDARDKNVIYVKDKVFMYADNISLGATDSAVITWMKQPRNQKLLSLIKKDTYPDLYPAEDIAESTNKKDKK